jgi:hypothetical protein
MFGSKRSEAIRSRVTLDEIEGLQIIIPPPRSRFVRLYLGLCLAAWVFGELGVLAALVGLGLGIGPHFANNPPVFVLVFWLVAWNVGGIFMLDIFIWQSRGHESIRIDPDGETLVVRRVGSFIPRRTRTYPLDRVRSLRFAPVMMPFSPFAFRETWEFQLQWLGSGGGSIAFDVDGRTERFGSQLSETESRRLIKTIKDHYKIQDDKDEALPVERL